MLNIQEYRSLTKTTTVYSHLSIFSSPMLRRPPVVYSYFSKSFSSVTTLPIRAKFHVAPPYEGRTKVYMNGPSHRTKMAAMPIYGKNLYKFHLQNRKFYDPETWYAASGTQCLQSLYKWWPWVDFDLFYGNVEFSNLGFSIGKSENGGFFRNYCDLNVCSCKQNIALMKVCEH